jgi:hypothetical protein
MGEAIDIGQVIRLTSNTASIRSKPTIRHRSERLIGAFVVLGCDKVRIRSLFI